MTYITPLRAGLFAAFLSLTTAMASPAIAQSMTANAGPNAGASMPNLSPSQIAQDVSAQINNRTGEREFIAPSFDPFEEDANMAGSASLRSVSSAIGIDGQPLSNGAVLDLGFYYNSKSNDPYDIRGIEDVAFLSGEFAPVVRRDNRVLECSSNVNRTVYDHSRYYAPALALSFYRPYRHYRGHYGYGAHRRPHWRRGYGLGTSRGWRRRPGTHRRDRDYDGFLGVSRRRDRDGDGESRRRRRDRDGDGVVDRRRDRDGDGETRRRRRDRDGDGVVDRRRDRDGDGETRRRRRDRDGDAVSRRRDRDTDSPRPTRRRPAVSTDTPSTSTATPGTGRRPSVDRPRRRRDTDTPRPRRPRTTDTPTPERVSRPSPKKRVVPISRPRKVERKVDRVRSRRAKSERRKLNFFPNEYGYGGRDVVTSVNTDCAREETLGIFIPNERLDAARFDGMTVIALDRNGQEYPIFVPPNYIEGFRMAQSGYVSGRVVAPTTTAPVYRAPVYQPPLTAACPTGTVLQPDNTCLQTGGTVTGYP